MNLRLTPAEVSGFTDVELATAIALLEEQRSKRV